MKISTGGMWEFSGWEIKKDEECSNLGGGLPCEHCGDIFKKENIRSDGSKWYEDTWICPFVVVAKNEGGYNSTGVCLQCIIEHGNSFINK